MPTKISKWSIQQQQMLKRLKEEQIQGDYVNWEKIAKELNENFKKTSRTSKQCREKYINYLKFGQNVQINLEWLPEQVSLLKKFYEDIGPSWALISSKLPNRSQNAIKNKFNNSIRRTAKTLCTYEADVLKKTKKSITFQILVAMIDFINQLQKIIKQMSLTINPQSTLFTFRTKILDFSLFSEEIDDEKILDLIKLIKTVNSRLRCFGVFKVKNRKQWKLSKKSLYAVQQFDKVTIQDCVKIEQRSNILIKDQENTKNLTKNYETIEQESPDQILFDLPWYSQKVDTKSPTFKEITLVEQYMDIMGQQNHNMMQLEHLFF